MRSKIRWAIVPTALSMVLAVATAASSDTVRTPFQTPITVSGTSGGSQSGSCGFVASSPNQVVVVNQPTALRFRVQSQGQPTLLISGSNGRSQCVMADNRSNGTIEVPGIWNQGTYSVFIGDRTGGGHPYTLSISQEN